MKEGKIIDKNYGSIPHLSISKLGQQADKKITIGQELLLTKKARDWRDLIIVTEKLDGSNVGIVRKNGKLIAITRSGYDAITSPYEQHHVFDKWLRLHKTKFQWLKEGWRICGEWLMEACGTKYDITECSPFVAFDMIDPSNARMKFIDQIIYFSKHHIPFVPIIHIGHPISIKNAMDKLGSGMYGKAEKPEGLVYRMERNGQFDFMAKFVRKDKEDGKYMDSHLINKGFEL